MKEYCVHTLEVMKLQVVFQTVLDRMLLEKFNVVTGACIPWLQSESLASANKVVTARRTAIILFHLKCNMGYIEECISHSLL